MSTRWVDVNKGTAENMEIRCRMVARDFKGGDKDRDDLFAETPPLEAKRILMSRAVTRRRDQKKRKLMFLLLLLHVLPNWRLPVPKPEAKTGYPKMQQWGYKGLAQ